MSDRRRGPDRRHRGTAPGRLAGDGLRGFCIGTADLVPGVSGSTVALLLGVYERLLLSVRAAAAALAAAARGDPAGSGREFRRIDWRLVAPVGAGLAVALGTLSGAIDWLLTNRAEATAGAFAGLVCAAALTAARQVRSWSIVPAVLSPASAAASGWVFGLTAEPVADPAGWMWFTAGVLGICAMILPGVSGSFVLLTIGVYAPFIDALSERHWAPLGLFGGGGLVGALAFSVLLSKLLDRHHDPVMAVMVGLMVGSLRVLWPWPNGVGIIDGHGEVISGTGLEWPSGGAALWPAVCAGGAFALALLASRTSERAPAG